MENKREISKLKKEFRAVKERLKRLSMRISGLEHPRIKSDHCLDCVGCGAVDTCVSWHDGKHWACEMECINTDCIKHDRFKSFNCDAPGHHNAMYEKRQKVLTCKKYKH